MHVELVVGPLELVSGACACAYEVFICPKFCVIRYDYDVLKLDGQGVDAG